MVVGLAMGVVLLMDDNLAGMVPVLLALAVPFLHGVAGQHPRSKDHSSRWSQVLEIRRDRIRFGARAWATAELTDVTLVNRPGGWELVLSGEGGLRVVLFSVTRREAVRELVDHLRSVVRVDRGTDHDVPRALRELERSR